MQHMYDVEWYGKTVRMYITKIEKLDWAGKSWDTKFVLMARKEWEDLVENGSGMPGHLCHTDVAISDEYISFEDLMKEMTIARIAAERTFRMNYGNAKPDNLDHVFLDILKFSKIDVLDVEMAKEKATEDMPHTIVKVCASRAQEKELDEHEAEYDAVKIQLNSRQAYLDPYHDTPPAYRKES
jgi:hypothetical protein